MIEYIHFNKNKPQYHNVYISNNRDKYAMVYDGDIWKLVDSIEITNKLCDDKICFWKENLMNFMILWMKKQKPNSKNFLMKLIQIQ